MKRIVRTLLVAATAGSLLSLAPVPAANAATVIVVNGFDYPVPSLGYVQQECTTGAGLPAFEPLYRLGGTLGTHATGMGFSATGGMAGVEAFVPDPTTVDAVTFSTYHPQASVNGGTLDGYFRVRYDAYYGYESLNTTAVGWAGWPNLAAVGLDWVYASNGAPVPGGAGVTLATFAAATAGNSTGAYVGFEFGCDGRDYYMDDFRVSSATVDRIFDFEGALSRTYLSATPTHFSSTPTRDLTRLNLIHGQNHHLLGDGTNVPDGDFIDGLAALYQRPYGASSYTRVTGAPYLASTYATFAIHPNRQTYYQIRTLPSAVFEASSSKVLLVTVTRRVRARAADTRIRRGRSMVVTGTIYPQDSGVTVRLQRLVDGRWRTVSTRTTTTGGKYRLTALARTTGKKRLRVHVAAARGNLANVSPSVVITVVRNPAPVASPVTVINPIPVETHTPGGGKTHAHRASATGAASLSPLDRPTVLAPPPTGVPLMQGRD